ARDRADVGVICKEGGKAAEAERQWRAAVVEDPAFAPAWLGLAELYLGQSRWAELDEVCGRLGSVARAAVEAAVLRARAHLARQEFGPARQLLEATIARAPQALWPRVILSPVLLEEGGGWAAGGP